MSLDISDILNDNTSGSFTITSKSLKRYMDYLEKEKDGKTDPETLFEDIQSAAKELVKSQPNMAMIRRTNYGFVSYFKRFLKAEKDRKELINMMLAKLQETEKELNENLKKIAENGARLITNFNKILTCSSSTLVRRIFEHADDLKRKFEIFCLKSDPPLEGVMLAEAMSKREIKTAIVADAQAGIVMDELNMVLLGADRLYENGFVNKSGTLAVCLLARHFNVPVYLAVETIKILKESERSIKAVEREPAEVYTGDKNITVYNSYYEKIPLDLVNKVICEEGVFETSDFSSWYLGD
jgi:translation initiation factor 2B subunit (eIF-2B alpha/beta/delta family)